MPRGSVGITTFTDLVLDCVRDASQRTGLGIAVIIAANRTRHRWTPGPSARLAVQYADHGGRRLRALERRAAQGAAEFAAFSIAERGGWR